MRSKKFLITGGNGFLGQALIERLTVTPDCSVVAPLRTLPDKVADGVQVIPLSALDGTNQWTDALAGVDVVIHAAARVHVMKEVVSDPLAAFREVNVAATLNLARQAAASGVTRFIFISSVKVNGEGTAVGSAFRADDLPNPGDAYGLSKLEAELGLQELATATGMEVVIIRPVLVYGPGVKANFLSMMRWLQRGVPLPFGAIHNRRSLVSVENLVDLVVTCADHPGAANQTFLASDGEDVSTSDLLRKLSKALGQNGWLLPVPVWIMAGTCVLLGRQALSQRLFGSLQVDISKNRERLDWTPPLSLDKGLELTAQHFLDAHKS
ncbi:UDP-glucose 4-epimerase family protein [Pseudomonas iridis]|uniref:UDP-glucose 4-epimerase family protein n=1 Tax=Pseudomonas iridis TaxID=2710587 RepID=UPI0021C029E2|nr:SDR family oxidoreductase [Pseudomonas iridis]MCT8948338.1 SDR family oxidoreductase [Pseudomonas iridis]